MRRSVVSGLMVEEVGAGRAAATGGGPSPASWPMLATSSRGPLPRRKLFEPYGRREGPAFLHAVPSAAAAAAHHAAVPGHRRGTRVHREDRSSTARSWPWTSAESPISSACSSACTCHGRRTSPGATDTNRVLVLTCCIWCDLGDAATAQAISDHARLARAVRYWTTWKATEGALPGGALGVEGRRQAEGQHLSVTSSALAESRRQARSSWCLQ
jgi:hypothetical protein